jgi:uncharacterized NAD(P)/FAD-binding protein YdhS
VRIHIIDRHPQFFTGVAYGNRSGPGSLTLFSLNDFLPDDERVRFTEWLTDHHRVTPGTGIDPAWFERHRADIAEGRWDRLFIPRRLYGAYLSERARTAMLAAESDGIAQFTLTTADVTAIDPMKDGYVVSTSHRDGPTIAFATTTVALTVGSPPARRLCADDESIDGLIHDVYDPGLNATLSRVRRTLAALPIVQRRILVVGGNATALEFVLACQDIVRDLQATITVLTPTGRPRHWRPKKGSDVAELRAIAALKIKVGGGGSVTAQELLDAVSCDLRAAVESGTDGATVPRIAASIPYFAASLNNGERAALAAHYGMQISNLLRQDSRDSVDIVESCVESGAVEFSAGRYRGCKTDGHSLRVSVTDDAGNEYDLDAKYGVVVGAMGFEDVSATRSPLLREMLRSGLVDPSSSNTGLRVDSRFRAAPGLFVVGPLVAGNVGEDMVIWHAESVRRIMAIARAVAPSIAREMGAIPRAVSPASFSTD